MALDKLTDEQIKKISETIRERRLKSRAILSEFTNKSENELTDQLESLDMELPKKLDVEKSPEEQDNSGSLRDSEVSTSEQDTGPNSFSETPQSKDHGPSGRGGGGTNVPTGGGAATATGTVSFFNAVGGYGFIDVHDADEDVFFHMEDVGGTDLEEGEEVVFEIAESDRGPRARNLTRL